jgi:hypothetical protein
MQKKMEETVEEANLSFPFPMIKRIGHFHESE